MYKLLQRVFMRSQALTPSLHSIRHRSFARCSFCFPSPYLAPLVWLPLLRLLLRPRRNEASEEFPRTPRPSAGNSSLLIHQLGISMRGLQHHTTKRVTSPLSRVPANIKSSRLLSLSVFGIYGECMFKVYIVFLRAFFF